MQEHVVSSYSTIALSALAVFTLNALMNHADAMLAESAFYGLKKK